MVNYTCDCCSFLTNKKSTYNDHLVSKKHLNKINNISVTSSNSSIISNITEPELQDDTASTLKIKDLENELKLKELEINNLKELLKVKDEMIIFLKSMPPPQVVVQQQQQQPLKENITMTIEEKPSTNTKLTRNQIIEHLTLTRKDAPIIEEFIKTELRSNKNIYLKTIFVEKRFNSDKYKNLTYYNEFKSQALVPSTTDAIFSFSSISNLVVNMFCKVIEKVDKSLCPIYCNDKHRNVFYVKTADGWDRKTDEEFDKIAKQIILQTERIANDAISNVSKLSRYFNDSYFKEFPKGISNLEVFELKCDKMKVLYACYSEHLPAITKHLKSSLSEITGNKIVKFKPLKEGKVQDLEVEIENEEEDY